MTAVMIGVDPTRGRTPRWRSTCRRSRWASCGSASRPARRSGLVAWAAAWPSGPGRSRASAGWVTCWPSSWLRPASGCWSVQPSSVPGCGCWPPGKVIRTTERRPVGGGRGAALAGPPPGQRRRSRGGAAGMVPAAPGFGPGRESGACRSTRCCASWCPAACPRRSPAHAARILRSAQPSGAAGQARGELAAEFLEDMRRLDAQMRESKKKLAVAVRASGTTVPRSSGSPGHRRHRDRRRRRRGPVRQPRSLRRRNGTAPIEVSSGNRNIYRLSLRGNRRINHAIHMAAITQIPAPAQRRPRLLRQEAGRRQDAQRGAPVPQTPDQQRYLRRLQADAQSAAAPRRRAREGNRGTTLTPARRADTPSASSSDKPLPSPPATLRRATPRRLPTLARPTAKKIRQTS